jgi:hypothetical protein
MSVALDEPAFERMVARDLEDGQHRNTTDRLDYFTTAYFHRAQDLSAELEQASFEIRGLYGIEGPGWLLADFPERWRDPNRRELILHAARMLESVPEIIGSSAHLLVVRARSLKNSCGLAGWPAMCEFDRRHANPAYTSLIDDRPRRRAGTIHLPAAR